MCILLYRIIGGKHLDCFFLSFLFSLCLLFNFAHNLWTVNIGDFIFGMYTRLVKPFQMTPRSMILTDLYARNSFFATGSNSVSETHLILSGTVCLIGNCSAIFFVCFGQGYKKYTKSTVILFSPQILWRIKNWDCKIIHKELCKKTG